MDLGGTWRARVADEDLRRRYPEPAFDDSAWDPIEVPGHWRSTPAFAATDGPLLHRTRFEAPPPAPGRRSWLVLDGLFYQGDVWLDGAYVGDTEGYFFPHEFEMTHALRNRSEHVLAVEAACSRPADRKAKRNITGVFQHWDCLDPGWNPGGIWRPVRIEESGPVRITALRVLCTEATEARAVLSVRALLDADEVCAAAVRTTVGETDHVLEHRLAAGQNRMQWSVTVDRPALWWPRALGDQPLHDLVVEVACGGEGLGGGGEGKGQPPSDTRTLRIGLRQVRMRSWVVSVNGERLFLKGSNQGPVRMQLAEATAADCERDVRLALDAGLDLLRLHAHVSRPELYDAADRAGLLLWQDLPLQWGYARGIRKQAVRQARAAVDLLGHHPSIAVWCGHNEPLALDVEPGATVAPAKVLATFLAGQQLPTWNKSVLDRSVKRALEKADPSRPVIAHSGVLPHLPQLDGTDSHLYFGWYHGHERDLPGFLAAVPRLARFVSEFGAQAVPHTAGFMEPERWPDLDWDRLGRTHALQRAFMDRHVRQDQPSFEAWRDESQRYQATVVKHHVEALRRLKYRPTGGFAHFCFADGHPAVTWSVLDHERVPKQAYAALAEACRPVIVVADRPAAAYAPGDAVALDVHVVSDLRHDLDGAVVTACLSWDGGRLSWRWQGDVGADDCVRVGTIAAVAPAAVGMLTLDLRLEHATVEATNRYESRVEM